MHSKMTRPTVRVVLVHDDDPIGREIALRLAALRPRIEVVSKREIPPAELGAIASSADIVLLPPTASPDIVRAFARADGPSTLLWSAMADPDLELHALAAGLAGTLPIDGPAALEAAIERSLAWQRRLRRARLRVAGDEAPATARWVWDALTQRLLIDAATALPVSRDDVRALLQREVIERVAGGAESFQHEQPLDGPDGPVRVLIHGTVSRGPTGGTVIRGQITAQALRPSGERMTRDALTGLPGREAFLEHLTAAHDRFVERGDRHAVVCLDLDGMHVVNDGLGHATGDLMLRWAADRIRNIVPDHVVARVGSDEFAVLLLDDDASPEAVGRRLVAELTAAVSLGGNLVYTGVRAGTARAADPTEPPDAVFRDAESALDRARTEKGPRLLAYSRELRTRQVAALSMDRDLRYAVQHRKLALHFQPIVRLSDASSLGFEALLRWKHPERGWVPPGDFIPTAEQNGLIVPIGRWVLEQATGTLRDMQRNHPEMAAAYVTVNLSPVQLHQSDLVRQVRAALHATGLPATSLRLEVTENSAMSDANGTLDVLRELRDLGVKILIDDFGTGYSALQYLAHLPADALKVDKSFVEGLGHDGRKTRVVCTIADLAESLGLQLVAEGIETESQLAWLRRLNVPEGQGYFFQRPVPAEEAVRMWSKLGQPRDP